MKEKASKAPIDLKATFKRCGDTVKAIVKGFVSGIWFVNIMRQIIITGGNIAESAFLLATLWVIINAVAHTLLTWSMPAQVIELVNYLSVIAFSALPELIIIPVIIICFSHWSLAYKQRSKVSAVWGILYTIPAGFFLVMTILAITTFVSTGGTNFVPASGMQLVIRCLAGWMYAVVNMLFKKLGEPHYASKMQDLELALTQKQEEMDQATKNAQEALTEKQEELDQTIADQKVEKDRLQSRFEHALKTANENFQTALSARQMEFEYRLNEITSQGKSQIEQLQNLLLTQNEQVKKLSERASSLAAQGLENWPKVLTELVNTGVKTVTVDDLSELTGISKRRINAAKSLQRHSRNKDLIMVNSAVEWLKKQPLVSQQNGHVECDTDPLELPVLTFVEG